MGWIETEEDSETCEEIESITSLEPKGASKFAQVLGFGGLLRGDAASPVNMGSMEGAYEDESSSAYAGRPIEPSFYQIGMRMADTQWAMNYQEAAIYLEEGANNDQFSTHPKRKDALPAYILTHTSWFYLLDLAASLLLLALAFAEPPAVNGFQVDLITIR